MASLGQSNTSGYAGIQLLSFALTNHGHCWIFLHNEVCVYSSVPSCMLKKLFKFIPQCSVSYTKRV